MKLIRPNWLGHFNENDVRQPVYSLDASRDGARLASGGLDGKVRVWSLDACVSTAQGAESGLRATMPAHNGSVLCVKFSPNNRWLASGSDDNVLIVWELDENAVSRKTFGEREELKESWKIHRRLLGHENDIVDLAWSYDSSLLVSVALDSSVIVWSGTTFEKLRTLSHNSSVKGVTFDPAGKYFATASDDRTIKVWRTSDFGCEQVIDKPFKKSPISTYFRRLSWSPDGAHIGGPNAMNAPVRVITIINRGTWSNDISLVGHEGAIEVVRFNPVIFRRGEHNCSILAGAGDDRTLSVWNTLNPKPVFTSGGMAEQSISDLAWSHDGLSLIVASVDGTITVCTFVEEEFGQACGTEANEEALSKYGAGRNGAILPESVEQLQLEDLSKRAGDEGVKGRMQEIMGGDGAAVATSIRTNGSTDKDVLMSDAPANTSILASPSKTTLSTAMIAPAQTTPAAAKPYVQKVTMVNGKKRVQPQLISSGSGTPAPPPNLVVTQTVAIDPAQQLDISAPSLALPKGGMPTALTGHKRDNNDDPVGQDGPSNKRHAASGADGTPEWIRPAVVSPATAVSQVRLGVPQVKSLLSLTRDGRIRHVLEARNADNAHDPCKITLLRGDKVEWTDYVRSSVVLLCGTPAFFAAASEDGGIFVWTHTGRRYMAEMVLEAVPAFLEARGDCLMAISAIGLLHVWDLKRHKSPFPPVSVAAVLDAAQISSDKVTRGPAITQASVTSKGLPILTLSNGDGFVYNADMFSWVRVSQSWWYVTSHYWSSATSLLPPNLADTAERSAGGLTNGTSSTARASARAADDRAYKPGLLSLVELRTNEELNRQGRGRQLQRVVKNALQREGFESLETRSSVAHLENRMSAAVLLDSPSEYRAALTVYARRVAEEGSLARVEELCRELYGPKRAASYTTTHERGDGRAWTREVLGFDKHDLLRACIVEMGKFRAVQRITTSYLDLLDRAASAAAAAGTGTSTGTSTGMGNGHRTAHAARDTSTYDDDDTILIS